MRYVPGDRNPLAGGARVRAPRMADHQDRMQLRGHTRSVLVSVQEDADDAWWLEIKRVTPRGLRHVKDVRLAHGTRRAFGPEENWHYTHGVKPGARGRFSLCIFGEARCEERVVE